MPWKEASTMSPRAEFLQLAQLPDANISQLARRFGISRKSAYTWLRRARPGEPITDRSRRPHASPHRTAPAHEQRVLDARDRFPAWGARKLRAVLHTENPARPLPTPSTITAVLRRHGRLDPARDGHPRDGHRFEHPAPNDLWQMDFKGHFARTNGTRCHPLTVLDDHSRFALGVVACADERTDAVRDAPRGLFEHYGLPARVLTDNGSPWGDEGGQPHTRLTVWLRKLGIGVSHGRPYHPPTQGKDERFHRTLNTQLLSRVTFTDVGDGATRFAAWRTVYNTIRPHEALGLAVPLSRYQASPRSDVSDPPAFEYGSGWQVRRVHAGGWRSAGGVRYRISKAFAGEQLGCARGRTRAVGDWRRGLARTIWACCARPASN